MFRMLMTNAAGQSPFGSKLSYIVGKASILAVSRSISGAVRETISRDPKTSCHKGLSYLKSRPPASESGVPVTRASSQT